MSTARYENPSILQSDHTVLVEVVSPRYIEGRDALARFAELVKSPEHVHTYRIMPLSIWNARAAGVAVEWVREKLRGLSKYDVPRHVEIGIAEFAPALQFRAAECTFLSLVPNGTQEGKHG